jgi:hypothetical protein
MQRASDPQGRVFTSRFQKRSLQLSVTLTNKSYLRDKILICISPYKDCCTEEETEEIVIVDANTVDSHSTVMVKLDTASIANAAVTHPRQLPKTVIRVFFLIFLMMAGLTTTISMELRC